jgi:hypothetical protein
MADDKRKRCFVISPIGSAGDDIRRNADMVLHGIIEPALPEFEVQRADRLASPDMINDKIMEAIFNSELAIADLTGHNPNVFYELGLRHMAEKPVIHIAANMTILPFDNAGMTTIFYDVGDWHSQQAAKTAIASHAQSCLAAERVSNPVTQARGSIKLAQSSDPRDALISDLHGRIARIEQAVEFSFIGEGSAADNRLLAPYWEFPATNQLLRHDPGEIARYYKPAQKRLSSKKPESSEAS